MDIHVTLSYMYIYVIQIICFLSLQFLHSIFPLTHTLDEGVNEEAALIICSDKIQNLDGNPNGMLISESTVHHSIVNH